MHQRSRGEEEGPKASQQRNGEWSSDHHQGEATVIKEHPRGTLQARHGCRALDPALDVDLGNRTEVRERGVMMGDGGVD